MFKGLKSNLKAVLIKFAMHIIKRYGLSRMDLNWVNYGISEIRRFNLNTTTDIDCKDLITNNCLEIIGLLAIQTHTRHTIEKEIDFLNKIIHNRPISPLSFEDDEFCSIEDETGLKQNKILPSLYRNGKNEFIYREAISLVPKFKVERKSGVLSLIEKDGIKYSGPTFVIKEDMSFSWFNSCDTTILDKTKFDPEVKFTVPLYTIEYPNDWYIPFVLERDLKEVRKFYKISEADTIVAIKYLDDEANFDNGKYKDEIFDRIKFLIMTVFKK